MTCTLHVAWDASLAGYNFGPGHPMAPVRLKLTMELAQAFGLGRQDGVSIEVPAAATDAELELIHDPAYIAMVRLAGTPALLSLGSPAAQDMTERALLMHGLGTEDDPVFPGMHEASAMVAGATLAAARAVWTSAAQHGVSIARVLTIGLHEHPDTLFPGTGRATEIGGPQAKGASVNVALPAGTGDAGWLRAFHAVVPPLLREFGPQVLVSQHGCDSHRIDPLANLELTIDAQRAAHAAIHALAHEVAGGRWLLTGGGGYEHVHVVPRSWTHLLFEAAGRPIDPVSATPQTWRHYVAQATSQTAPETMTEGGQGHFDLLTAFETGYNLADPVDQAIMATRKAVFPLHGLMP